MRRYNSWPTSPPTAGATKLGIVDILVALALLALLLYASWKQFPAFEDRVFSAPGVRNLAPHLKIRFAPLSLAEVRAAKPASA